MFIGRLTWLWLLILQLVLFALLFAAPVMSTAITDTWPPDEQGPHSPIHAVSLLNHFAMLFCGFAAALLVPAIIIAFCSRNDPPATPVTTCLLPPQEDEVTNYDVVSPFLYALALCFPILSMLVCFILERCGASPAAQEVTAFITLAAIAGSLLYFVSTHSTVGCFGFVFLVIYFAMIASYTPLERDTIPDTPTPNLPVETTKESNNCG